MGSIRGKTRQAVVPSIVSTLCQSLGLAVDMNDDRVFGFIKLLQVEANFIYPIVREYLSANSMPPHSYATC